MTLEELLCLIGPMPERVPLHAETVESVDCGSHVRRKVQYDVQEGERISAFVLVPKNIDMRAPAVFCHHQHASNFALGKSEVVGLSGDHDQAYAVELAERGYVTFAPDAIAFEERNWSKISGHAEYLEMASRLVQGRTLLAKILHDAMCGLDYLQTLPDVDTGRMGFIGHSYGGRMAIWLPAVDKRIKASVSNCGCINYKDSLTKDAGIQPEFCVPGIMEHGDIEDVVRLVEPSALLISATEDDVWSRGARNIYNYAQPSFTAGSLDIKMWPGKHVFTKVMREFAYDFLDRHLNAEIELG
jgi:dienelactone hydrolase